jgi:tetratricopeptide (TPR) repeat protein
VAHGDGSRDKWDFFVSYTQADQAWAEWIAWILEEDGHRVLVQAWDFVPGSNWIQGMQAGTRDAARTIALLSPGYLESVYGSAEWQAAWAADPAGTGRKLLTVRVTDCDRPGLLAGVVSVDMFGLAEAAAKARLRSMIAGALAGRTKPGTAPGFPGTGRAMPREPRFPGALPRVWKVPARNPHFTGRGPDLDSVARGLATGSAVTVHSVHGMGGVGKTQLAIEYAYAHAVDYDVVWWIAAEEPASIPDQFTPLAARLGLDPAADPDKLRDQVCDAIRGVPGWLLIFDNADTVGDIAPWLPAGPLPAGILGHVITTTRRGGFAALGQVMDLDVIDLAAAVRLLRSRVLDLGQEIGEQIAQELERLPLALEQAAAYLDRTQMPGREYLDLLRSRAYELYARGQVTGRPDTIATLWDISLQRISGESPAAVQLLDVCAYLAPEPVPLDQFTTQPGVLPEPLATAAADHLAFNDTLAVLVDYSLAKRTPAGLQLHRLVQAAIRARHDPPSPTTASPDTRMTNPAAEPAAGPARYPLAVAVGLLRAGAPGRVTAAPEDWPRWAVLLPHVLAATGYLDRAADQLGPQAMADASWLLGRAGTYLQVRARFADARELLERALTIDEATYGPDHPDFARALNNLAQILLELGQPGEARPLLERALSIDEAAYGPDRPEVARDLNNLAQILQDLGQPGEARPLLERALAIDEAAYGPDHPLVAAVLNSIALILLDLRQPAAARPLLERALSIDEAAYGPSHPDVATNLNCLALVLRPLGQHAAARPLQERALSIDEAAFGPDHPTVARDLNSLAQILQDLGQPAAARPLQERALAIDQATYGPSHPTVATALNNLATILQDLGQPDAARPLLERAQAIAEAAQSARPRPPGGQGDS